MEKFKYTFYVAQAIEGLKEQVDSRSWIKSIHELGSLPEMGMFDPVEREAQKTGTCCGDTGKYIHGVKQGGHWGQFHDIMDSIWFDSANTDGNLIRILLHWRDRFILDGNTKEDLDKFGDYQAVVRSNFIFAYMEKNVKTVGTLFEIQIAFLLRIPVYLILPDQTVTEANSTLIHAVKKSGGDIFYNSKQAVDFVKNKYNIKG